MTHLVACSASTTRLVAPEVPGSCKRYTLEQVSIGLKLVHVLLARKRPMKLFLIVTGASCVLRLSSLQDPNCPYCAQELCTLLNSYFC